MAFESVNRTHVGLKRRVNEDSLLSRPERGLWLVADGMGGHDAGEVASGLVVQALANLPEQPVDGLLAEVVEAVQRVNRSLLRMARADRRPRTIGTTVVGILIGEGEYRCFWAGDSRAYRIRDGRIAQLTRDHSLVQELVAAGMLLEEEAQSHPNANVVTRAVGVADEVHLDLATGDVRPGDLFLLASDGLTRVVGDDELLAELSRLPLEQAADALMRTVLARGAPDNVTLIAIRCG